MKKYLRNLLVFVSACAILLTGASALTVEEALQVLEEQYVNEIPKAAYEAETLEELFAVLGDPYTYYMTKEEYESFLASVEQTSSVVGIGVQVIYTEEGLHVAMVINGGPAERAGLLTGDLIIAADGVSCVPGTEAATELIRGEAGTEVTLLVRREDGSLKEFTIPRELVVVNNTNLSVLDGHIGVIDCNSFGSDTGTLVRGGVLAHGEEVDVWWMDLRGNVGGYSDAAVESVGVFAGAGVHLYFRDSADNYYVSYAVQSPATQKPVIVLTDGWSASGSEVVAADVRDCLVGISVGGRTFGKGVAQIILDNQQYPQYFDEDGLKVTAYRFYSTNGVTTDTIGVIPTIMVADEHTENVARILSEGKPEDSMGYLRITLGGRQWYVNLRTAQTGKMINSFSALMQALPPNTPVGIGIGGDNWVDISTEVALEAYGNGAQSRWFTDLEDMSCEDALNVLATYGILQGTGAGEFHPEEELTRAQLCAMLAQALHVTTAAPSVFADVADGRWYTDDIMAMYLMGFMTGYGDETFRPEQPVTNEELVTVMGRLGTFLSTILYDTAKVLDVEGASNPALEPYADWAAAGARLMLYTQNLAQDGSLAILYNDLEDVDPHAAVTRWQAGVTLYNLLVSTGILRY